MPRIPKKFIEQAKEAGNVLLQFKLDTNSIRQSMRKKGSILNIGEFIFAGQVAPKTAVDMYEAFVAGSERRMTKEQGMLLDLLDGCKGPHEIHHNTGLPIERCEEIYKYWVENNNSPLWLLPGPAEKKE